MTYRCRINKWAICDVKRFSTIVRSAELLLLAQEKIFIELHILKQSKCKKTTAEVIRLLFYVEANWVITVRGLLFNSFYFAFILFGLDYCLIDVNYTFNSLASATTKKYTSRFSQPLGLLRTHQRDVSLLRNSYAGLNPWTFLSNSCVTIS